MLNFKSNYWYFFVLSLIFSLSSITKSDKLNHYSFDLVSFPEKKINYKFLCGSEKIYCKVSISRDYIFINKTKIYKDQVKNIKNKVICKNEFGFSRCLPGNIKDIAFKKITLIFYQNDLLKAKLIFIKDLNLANEFSNNLKKWLEWNSL
tara:strand:- start:538 stop:984 length:447 start_codon:yes stop_codon:yes gene_type:complete